MTGPTRLSPMERALQQAREAALRGEVPIGAVVVGPDGTVLAEAGNRTEGDRDPTAHAELLAIRAAAAKLGTPRLVDCVLPHPAALLRRLRSQGRRRRARSAHLQSADLPSPARSLRWHRRAGSG